MRQDADHAQSSPTIGEPGEGGRKPGLSRQRLPEAFDDPDFEPFWVPFEGKISTVGSVMGAGGK